MFVITAEHVAIAELVVYIPIFLLTLWVVLRHGAHKQLGWIYVLIFSIIRVAGAVMEILSTKNADDTTDKEWAVILQSVGLSPLLLSTLGILKRVFDEISEHSPSAGRNMALQGLGSSRGLIGKIAGIYTKRATAASRRSRAVQLLHIPALIALVLAIMGGTDQASSDVSKHASGQTETHAAVIVFILIYMAACVLWAISARDFSIMSSSQTRIYLCVLLALPLLAVRILYSVISAFSHRKQFSTIDGDETIRLVMATIEEFLVVFMYTILGVITPRSTNKSRKQDHCSERGF
ncbi:hypothetical protein ST47_g3778 [Ascochyta rabiei]|uniref:DUF7702 domain-containing protein n=1 Tax=Didymella rabiei TaxID=5454 RepID=A0A163GZQ0_DIDRA|nr:hypothetical protein ST47_g3778 [Ascochyta rabiei]